MTTSTGFKLLWCAHSLSRLWTYWLVSLTDGSVEFKQSGSYNTLWSPGFYFSNNMGRVTVAVYKWFVSGSHCRGQCISLAADFLLSGVKNECSPVQFCCSNSADLIRRFCIDGNHGLKWEPEPLAETCKPSYVKVRNELTRRWRDDVSDQWKPCTKRLSLPYTQQDLPKRDRLQFQVCDFYSKFQWNPAT